MIPVRALRTLEFQDSYNTSNPEVLKQSCPDTDSLTPPQICQISISKDGAQEDCILKSAPDTQASLENPKALVSQSRKLLSKVT